jgi:hypothetical protein
MKMKKSLKFTFALLLLFTVVISSCIAQGGNEGDTPSQQDNDSRDSQGAESAQLVAEPGYQQQSIQGFEFQWKVDGEILDVIISAPTTGWVSVGFDPTNRMKDANYIMAYVDSSGQGVIEDHFGTNPTAHQSDISLGGTQDLELVSASQSGGSTTVNVRLPLVTNDEFDRPLTPGQTYVVIWAFGPDNADNFSAIHRRRGFFRIEL